ncbi:MAG: FAD-dependent monooxygenase [Puniceicoccaceae bacterium]
MDTQVAIIGGGPCGLLSSLLLARQGIRNVVFEKHPDISFHPKAMGVTRRTAEIYRQLGILDRMREKDLPSGIHAVQIWLRSFAGEEFGRSPLVEVDESLTPCGRIHCPQPHTEAVLKEAVEREEFSEIRFHTRVESLEDSGDGVTVSFRDPTSGDIRTLRAQWAVAADGAASPIREKLGIETRGPGDRGHFLNVYFRADYGKHLKGRESVLYSLLDDESYEFFVAVNGRDEWLMHHFLQAGESAADYSPAMFQDIIRGVSGLPDVPVEVISVSPWVMSPKVATRWRAGRIFLTGDAAARLSPAGGLGMNTGLQSAFNLAWKLALVLKGQAAESLLDTYERERLGVVKFIFENAEGNADEVFQIVGAAMTGHWDVAKEKIRHSRRGGSGAGVDLGPAYGEGGALVPDDTDPPSPPDPVNDYVPTARPGHRAPHLAIRGGNGETSTLDLFGKDFVLLCGPDGGFRREAFTTGAGGPAKAPRPGVVVAGESFRTDMEAFLDLYGISADGAVLVRPDGYVAARWPDGKAGHEDDGVEKALADILGL